MANSRPREHVVCPKCGDERSVGATTAWKVRTGRQSGDCLACAMLVNGHTRHRLFNLWIGMRQRCNNPNSSAYANYGGRGIAVCDRWNDSFDNFTDDMDDSYEPGLWIERIDNDGPYAPENCRWATQQEQAQNRRTGVLLTHDGRTLSITEWASVTGIKRNTITCRLKLGWRVEDALTLPIRPGLRRDLD